MTKNSSNSSKSPGNTEKQGSSAKHWCFTLNNYSKKDITLLQEFFSAKEMLLGKYVFQEEIGESGTPHLQGYVGLFKKYRLTALKKYNPKIHWELCKNIKASIRYCSDSEKRIKDGKVYSNIRIPKKIKAPPEPYGWQKDVVSMIETDADERKIYWYWDKIGKIGKTDLCRYLVYRKQALIVSGKTRDIMYAITAYEKSHGDYPDIILINISRTMMSYCNYDAIEQIKDGLFFSGKYEACSVYMNKPHILCFANSPPNIETMSKDRWEVIDLNYLHKETIVSTDYSIEDWLKE